MQDEVVSRDEKTQKNSVQKVTQLFRHVAKQTLRLRFSNGETIEATPEHPFFVSGKGFRPARVLAVGMAIATLGEPVKVEAVQSLAEPKTVYNFGVGDTQTYFVGKTGIWVHNECALNSKLKVVLMWRKSLPNVTRNNLSAEDYDFAKKISSYRGGRMLHGEINNYVPGEGTLAGYDGWWDKIGGPKVSLKRVTVATVRRVKDEAKRADERAKAAKYLTDEIETFIDAPLINAKDLLAYIKPGQPLDTIPTKGGAIKNIVVFCKDGVIVHLDPS